MFSLSNPIVQFIIRFFIIYTLLTILWGTVDKSYGGYIRNISTYFFENFGQKGYARFQEIPPTEANPYDINIMIANTDQIALAKQQGSNQVQAHQFPVNSWFIGYLSTILLISLILASPIPLKRLPIPLILGFILINAIIFFKIWIRLTFEFNGIGWMGQAPLGSSMIVQRINAIFALNNLGTTMILPLFIWLAVTFRKDDWKMLTEAGKDLTRPKA